MSRVKDSGEKPYILRPFDLRNLRLRHTHCLAIHCTQHIESHCLAIHCTQHIESHSAASIDRFSRVYNFDCSLAKHIHTYVGCPCSNTIAYFVVATCSARGNCRKYFASLQLNKTLLYGWLYARVLSPKYASWGNLYTTPIHQNEIRIYERTCIEPIIYNDSVCWFRLSYPIMEDYRNPYTCNVWLLRRESDGFWSIVCHALTKVFRLGLCNSVAIDMNDYALASDVHLHVACLHINVCIEYNALFQDTWLQDIDSWYRYAFANDGLHVVILHSAYIHGY